MDADSPENICKAIKSHGGLANTVLLTGNIETHDFKEEPKKQFNLITRLHDFIFYKDEILVRHQANIGELLLHYCN